MIICSVPDISSAEFISLLISIAALIASIYTATITIRSHSQRDFFMEEFKILKEEYSAFIRNVRMGEMSAEEIRDNLRHYSEKINSLSNLLSTEYIIDSKSIINPKHSELQDTITDLDSINDQYGQAKVEFSSEERTIIDQLHLQLNNSIIKTILQINNAQSLKIWEKEVS